MISHMSQYYPTLMISLQHWGVSLLAVAVVIVPHPMPTAGDYVFTFCRGRLLYATHDGTCSSFVQLVVNLVNKVLVHTYAERGSL
eukprot:6214457-Pleurochrysis_carterae.AAC.2